VIKVAGPTVVPDVEGETRQKARAAIMASDLIPIFLNLEPITNPNLARVAKQEPPAGTSVARQSNVRLYLQL
jgi:beta-lactam-binding protein with PASTA domain